MARRSKSTGSKLVSLADARRPKRKAKPDPYAAQKLMYEAFEVADPEERVALAQKAISLSPGCADAYVILAEETAESLAEAVEILQRGVSAAEDQFGAGFFEEYSGVFWLDIDTRPYMRARAELAEHLWQFGETDQAIEHFQTLLQLNPNDNQGIRDRLLLLLIELQKNKEARTLLAKYKDDGSALWLYSRALLAFRSRGATKRAELALQSAFEQNPFVPGFLLGELPQIDELPEYIGFGDESEAISYVIPARTAWVHTNGALKWLHTRREEAMS